METKEEVSESESSDVSETITMETKVTGNGTVYPEKVSGVTEEEYLGLKETEQIMNIYSRTAEPAMAENVKETNEGDCSEDKDCINQELLEPEQDLAHTPLEFKTIPAYKMSGDSFDILENKQSVDFLRAALNEISDKNLACEELVQRASDTESQSSLVTENTTVDSEGDQEEYRFSESPTALVEDNQGRMVTFQTITEVVEKTEISSDTGSENNSTGSPAIIDLDEEMEEKCSENSGNEKDVENVSTTELMVENATSLDKQHLVNLFTINPNGAIQRCFTSNIKETLSESTIYENEMEPILSVIPNEPSLISTPIENSADKSETVYKEFRSVEKYLPKINEQVEFMQENESVQILDDTERTSYELEGTDLQAKKATDNVNDRHEAQSKSKASKIQWDLQTPGERSNSEKLTNENVDTEHVDFAAARRQWLMIEETSKSQSCQTPFKQPKNQLKTKCINVKEKRCDSSVSNSMQKEGTYPYPTSVNFPKDKGRNNHLVGSIFDTDVNYWSSSVNLTKEEDILASQENNDLVRDLDQNLTLKLDAFSVSSEENDFYLDESAHRSQALLAETPSFVPLVHRRQVETPIEKEIRRNIKREESLRRARGITKHTCSGEYVEIKSPPFVLQPNSSPSTKVKNNQLAEMQMQREILFERKREEDLVRQGKIRETYNEGLSPEIEARKKVFEQQYVTPLSTSRNTLPPITIPHINTSSSFLLKSPLNKSPSYNEIKLSNVIILENDAMILPGEEKVSYAAPPKAKNPNEWPSETGNVIILGTPNLIVRSSSDFSLSSASATNAEVTVQNNPFFKLRSSGSILDQEIKKVQEREEELRRQRYSLCAMPTSAESCLSSPTSSENFCPGYCESINISSSSPMSAMMELGRLHKLAQKFEKAESILKKNDSTNTETRKTHRKNAMALRWEAGIFADDQDNEL
eukprot:gi/632940383/ref/XP_007885290.1/ PREDICTED: A-kinase anchor protein 2-like isoform X2 [Callorhinchus milii]